MRPPPRIDRCTAFDKAQPESIVHLIVPNEQSIQVAILRVHSIRYALLIHWNTATDEYEHVHISTLLTKANTALLRLLMLPVAAKLRTAHEQETTHLLIAGLGNLNHPPRHRLDSS